MSRQGIPACYDTGVEASARWPPAGCHCSTQWWTGGVAPVDCLAETPSWCIFFFGWDERETLRICDHTYARGRQTVFRFLLVLEGMGLEPGWSVAHRDHPVAPPLTSCHRLG